MKETQPINIGSRQDLSALANQPKKVSFEAPPAEEISNINNDADTYVALAGASPQTNDDPEMRQKHKRLVKILRGYANSSFGKRGVLSEYDLEIDSL